MTRYARFARQPEAAEALVCQCGDCLGLRAEEEELAERGGPPANDQLRLPLFPLPHVAGDPVGSEARVAARHPEHA